MIDIITPGAIGILCLFVFLRIRQAVREVMGDDVFESNTET